MSERQHPRCGKNVRCVWHPTRDVTPPRRWSVPLRHSDAARRRISLSRHLLQYVIGRAAANGIMKLRRFAKRLRYRCGLCLAHLNRTCPTREGRACRGRYEDAEGAKRARCPQPSFFILHPIAPTSGNPPQQQGDGFPTFGLTAQSLSSSYLGNFASIRRSATYCTLPYKSAASIESTAALLKAASYLIPELVDLNA